MARAFRHSHRESGILTPLDRTGSLLLGYAIPRDFNPSHGLSTRASAYPSIIFLLIFLGNSSQVLLTHANTRSAKHHQ